MIRAIAVRSILCVIAACIVSLFAWSASAQDEALHSLRFAIHEELVGTGAGQLPLTDWQDILDAALIQASSAIHGFQGPADTACCTDIEADAPLSTFTGPQFLLLDNPGEFAALRTQEGPGIYIVLDISFCQGFSSTLLGCADTPGSFLVVDLDKIATLGLTIAHERGHNANLNHVFGEPCLLMSASNGGGCISPGECQAFIDDANTVGDSCDCLDGTQGPPVADGGSCTDASGCGVCSGGMCGACTTEASAQLFAAGDASFDTGGDPTDLLGVSTLTGGYSTVGGLGGTINGLAFDSNRGVLWGLLEGGASADQLVQIDRVTGAVMSNLGSVGNPAAQDLVALAFDPNADLLYAIELTEAAFSVRCPSGFLLSVLRTVDPDNPTMSTQVGVVENFLCSNGAGVEGLAYDSQNNTLWGSYFLGTILIDFGSCPGFPSTCGVTLFQYDPLSDGPSSASGIDVVVPSGLAYEPTSGRLFKTGFGQGLVGLPVLQVIDAGTGNPADSETGELLLLMGTDGYTIGGLAAPEPDSALLQLAALAALAGIAHRFRRAGRRNLAAKS